MLSIYKPIYIISIEHEFAPSSLNQISHLDDLVAIRPVEHQGKTL